ncbi:hypothetical protein ACSD7O_19375 [Methylorubrum extorquens]|uniref:hypothetical protein n=1 Tax=Methylorubrum extorquens TaxID=408 RepID=UPI003F5F3EF0
MDWLAENPAPSPAGNGGPALDPAPTYEDLARIGSAVHGQHWEGKVAPRLGEHPRTLHRWRNGAGAPSARSLAWARQWALQTAADVLAAAGEQDLADDVAARLQALKSRASGARRRKLAEAAAAA